MGVLLLNVAVYSQNLPTNKDSIKVAISDMDKASLKMIERKNYEENFRLASEALKACDSSKIELKSQVSILRSNLANYKQINVNLEKDTKYYKKIAENEKSVGLRRGFFGFLKGVGVTITIVGIYALWH